MVVLLCSVEDQDHFSGLSFCSHGNVLLVEECRPSNHQKNVHQTERNGHWMKDYSLYSINCQSWLICYGEACQLQSHYFDCIVHPCQIVHSHQLLLALHCHDGNCHLYQVDPVPNCAMSLIVIVCLHHQPGGLLVCRKYLCINKCNNVSRKF